MGYPLLFLPEMFQGDFIILGSGPSLDDYDLSPLENTQATVFCMGRSYRYVKPDWWVIGDWQRGIQCMEEDEVLCSQLPKIFIPHIADEIEKVFPGVKSNGIVLEDHADTGLGNETFTVAMEAAVRLGAKRIYVLGVDGGCSASGFPRRRRYSLKCIESFAVDWFYWAGHLDYSVSRSIWDIIASKLKIRERLRNLSTTSCLKSQLGIFSTILDWPFGNIDRYGPCIFVRKLTEHGLQYLNALRLENPSLALVIESAEGLDDCVYSDILITNGDNSVLEQFTTVVEWRYTADPLGRRYADQVVRELGENGGLSLERDLKEVYSG